MYVRGAALNAPAVFFLQRISLIPPTRGHTYVQEKDLKATRYKVAG